MRLEMECRRSATRFLALAQRSFVVMEAALEDDERVGLDTIHEPVFLRDALRPPAFQVSRFR
jgi:hypothetical protein